MQFELRPIQNFFCNGEVNYLNENDKLRIFKILLNKYTKITLCYLLANYCNR